LKGFGKIEVKMVFEGMNNEYDEWTVFEAHKVRCICEKFLSKNLFSPAQSDIVQLCG